MPEVTEVQEQNEVEFSLPASNVPVREGEERFQAGLNLEDTRRRESVIADMQRQLKALSGTSSGEILAKLGRAERERQRLVRNKVRELENGNNCPPATIINLNPVNLGLSGQLQDFKMPAAGKGLTVNLNFRGRTFTGSYMTIMTPKVWLKTTGSSNDPTGDRPTFEAKHVPPTGLAYQFYSHYSEGAADAQHMGGILIFEGDIRALDKQRLERTGRMVKVPQANPSPDDIGEVLYSTTPLALDEYLASELSRQRSYCDTVIAQGHSYYTSQSDDERKQLSNRHITWHNYAVQCGYLEKALPWASERLKDSPLNQAVYCPDCRTKREDPDQYFCRNCNTPFDAFAAFMAGKQVSPDRLAAYDEKSNEWQQILAEMSRRRSRMALLLNEEKITKKAKAD